MTEKFEFFYFCVRICVIHYSFIICFMNVYNSYSFFMIFFFYQQVMVPSVSSDQFLGGSLLSHNRRLKLPTCLPFLTFDFQFGDPFLTYMHFLRQQRVGFFLVCFCFKFFAQDIFGDLLSLPLTHPRFPFHIHPTPYYFTLKVKNENRNCGVNFVLDNYS